MDIANGNYSESYNYRTYAESEYSEERMEDRKNGRMGTLIFHPSNLPILQKKERILRKS